MCDRVYECVCVSPHVIIFLLSHACMPLLLLTDLNAIVYFVAVKHHHNFNTEVRTGYVLNRALVNINIV